MTTQDFITELFCRVDDQMKEMPKHSQASLYPSEIVCLAFIFAIKGVGNRPLMVETVLSMLTLCNHFERVMHREWAYFQMRLAYTMAAFNMLVQWHGLEPDEHSVVHLSIAEFSL